MPVAKKETVKKTATKPVATKKFEAKKAPAKTATKTTVAKKPTTKTATKTVVKKPATKKEPKVVNSIEQILNPTNNDNVVLYDEKDNAVEFEQIALIPLDQKLYCILRPVKGIEDEQAYVFNVVEEKNDIYLDVVEDDEIIDSVFEVYYKLFEESQNLKKK